MATKKENVEAIAPDPVLDNLKKAGTWIEKNGKRLLIGIGAMLAAVLVGQMISSQADRDASEVTTQLAAGVKIYDDATDPQRITTTTVTAELHKPMLEAREKFAQVIKDHPDHGASQLARLYDADLARRLGKPAEAEQLYKDYIARAKSNDSMMFLALEGAGYALEDQNKLDEALDYFSKIGGEGPTMFFKDYGLKHKARLLEKKGDKAGAIAALQAIVAIEPPSSLRSAAEERLKSLQ